MQHLEPQIIIASISPNYYMKSHLMLCKVAVNKDIIIILLYLLSGTVPLNWQFYTKIIIFTFNDAASLFYKKISYIRRLAYCNVTTFADIFKGLISLVSMHANVYNLINTTSRNCIDMFTDDGAISNNCCEF